MVVEAEKMVLSTAVSVIKAGKIFSDSVLATAVLDRLLHHSSIVNIREKSYRLKEKQKNGLVGAKIMGGLKW